MKEYQCKCGGGLYAVKRIESTSSRYRDTTIHLECDFCDCKNRHCIEISIGKGRVNINFSQIKEIKWKS